MAERILPGAGLTGFWDLGADGWKDGMDQNLLTLSALSGGAVESRSVALPSAPASPVVYIVKSDDPTNPSKLAAWTGPAGSEAWVYITPLEGWAFYVKDEGRNFQYDGANWVEYAGGGGGSVAVVGPAQAARYWRISGMSSLGGAGYPVSFAEISFIDDAANPLTGTGSASSDDGTNVAANALDADTATFWAAATEADEWFQIDLGAGGDAIVGSISFTAINADPDWQGQATDFTLEASDDGVTWVTCQTSFTIPSLSMGGVSAVDVSAGEWPHALSWPSMAGNAGKVLTVNPLEDGLVWAEMTGGGGTPSGQLLLVPLPYAAETLFSTALSTSAYALKGSFMHVNADITALSVMSYFGGGQTIVASIWEVVDDVTGELGAKIVEAAPASIQYTGYQTFFFGTTAALTGGKSYVVLFARTDGTVTDSATVAFPGASVSDARNTDEIEFFGSSRHPISHPATGDQVFFSDTSTVYMRLEYLNLNTAEIMSMAVALPYGGARIAPTALQNYTVTGAYDKIRFSQASRDTHGFWDSQAPNQLTIPVGLGITKVRLTAGIAIDGSDSVGNNYFTIRKNGTWGEGLPGTSVSTGTYNNPSAVMVSDVIDVNEGDVFTLEFWVADSFAANFDRGQTFLAIEIVEITASKAGVNARVSELVDVGFQSPPTDGQSLIWDAASGKWIAGTPVVAQNVAAGVNKPFRGAMAKFTATKSVPGGQATYLDWQDVEYDTDGLWSAGSPQYFTIPAGVTKVRLHGTAYADAAALSVGDGISLRFEKNDVPFMGDGAVAMNAAFPNNSITTSSPVIAVTPGDTFRMRYYNAHTAAVDLTVLSQFSIEIVEAQA